MADDPRAVDDPPGVDNPLWQIVRTIPSDPITEQYEQRWEPMSYPTARDGARSPDRHTLAARYTWAIPDPTSVAFVADHASPVGIVEVGAGTGYWSWQLAQRGVDVIAYDAAPPDRAHNHWHQREGASEPEVFGFAGFERMFYEVVEGDAAVAADHPDRTLFLCWPPMSDMAARALGAYSGTRVIYIGEGSGGCTADDDFHEALDAKWTHTALHRPVQWWGILDDIEIWERR